MTIRTEIDIKGVDGVIATLRSLPPEVVSKRGGPVKLALAKGARMLRDAAKRNLVASMSTDDDYQNTQLLEKNVIASRGKPPMSGRGERYLVRVKRKTYPGRDGKPVTTHKTAHLKEYGSSHQPATPWLRPAVQQHGRAVIEVIVADLLRRLDVVVRKLASQNKVRG
jgi:HK97 gp10 family phage protein